jgi:hypothetical protein
MEAVIAQRCQRTHISGTATGDTNGCPSVPYGLRRAIAFRNAVTASWAVMPSLIA